MGPGGGVADEWELVGPFKAWAAEDETAVKPAGPASARSQPGRASAVSDSPPEASSNGLFTLRTSDMDLDPLEVDPVGPAIDPSDGGLFAPAAGVEDKFWYLDLGFRMGVTRLHYTKAQLDRRLDVPRKIDVFGVFNNPETPIDRKGALALTTGYIGIGRRETEWLTWNFYFGSGVGTDRDHQRWLLANQRVNFKYAMYYTGMTVDIYPWGLSQRGAYANVIEHFKASRPYLVTGVEIGYLKARGWGSFKISPFPVYRDSQGIEDLLVSYLLGFGWEIPLNERWAYNISVHYTYHFYRPAEYNGWNVTYALRYAF